MRMAWVYGHMHAPWPRVRRARLQAACSLAAPPPPPSPPPLPARPQHARARRAPPPRPPRTLPPASPPPPPLPPRGSWPSAHSLSRSRAAAPRAPPRPPPRSPRHAPIWGSTQIRLIQIDPDRFRSIHTDAPMHPRRPLHTHTAHAYGLWHPNEHSGVALRAQCMHAMPRTSSASSSRWRSSAACSC